MSDTLNTGKWSDDEQERFIKALELFPKDWNKITEYIGTRTKQQVQSHAQKYQKHQDDLKQRQELLNYWADESQDRKKRIRRPRVPVDYAKLLNNSKSGTASFSKAHGKTPHPKKESGNRKTGKLSSRSASNGGQSIDLSDCGIQPNTLPPVFSTGPLSEIDHNVAAVLSSLRSSHYPLPIAPKPPLVPAGSYVICPVYPYPFVPQMQGQVTMGVPVYPYPGK